MKSIHPYLYPPPSRGRIGLASPSAPARLKNHLAAVLLALVIVAMGASTAFADGWASNTKASNTGSIANTRHNLSLSFLPISWATGAMDYWRNNYGEVCVYCHTPHGANNTIDAPLWNRTNPDNTYTLYNIPLQSGQSPTQPGVNSLTCLSCHDGTVAIDSIINMPGSGKYSAAQQTTQSDAFLDTWTGTRTPGDPHFVLGEWVDANNDGFGDTSSCLNCHSTNGLIPVIPFDAFALGTDLTNDHPVGVKLPDTATYDFKAPTATDGTLKFFDTNGDGRADNNEVRFYDTGEGFEVECASCHDPHGVESAGPGSEFIPSFLRVNNNNASSLCLTCHDK
ncbi:MAG: cytochrome c3 family protein [Candidatus Nitrospinota bacterium M3_3B_026]